MSKPDLSSRHFQSKISKFCELRIAPIASKRTLSNVEAYLVKLIAHRRAPPLLNGRIDWTEIAQACRLGGDLTGDLKQQIRIALDAILRWLGAPPVAGESRSAKRVVRSQDPDQRKPAATASSTRKPRRIGDDDLRVHPASPQRGPEPKPIQPFPDPLFEASDDPAAFQDALVYQMSRFGESYWQLHRAVVRLGP